MTTSTTAPTTPAGGPSAPREAAVRITPRVALSDIAAVTGRNLRHWLRQP